jgi:hypothetical protein
MSRLNACLLVIFICMCWGLRVLEIAEVLFSFFSDFGVSGFLIHLGVGVQCEFWNFWVLCWAHDRREPRFWAPWCFTLAQKVERCKNETERGRLLLMWLDTPSSGVLWVSGFCETLRLRDCSQDWILDEVELVLKESRAGSRDKPAWCFQSSIVLRVEQALWINSFWSFHHLHVDEIPGWEGERSRTWGVLCILG